MKAEMACGSLPAANAISSTVFCFSILLTVLINYFHTNLDLINYGNFFGVASQYDDFCIPSFPLRAPLNSTKQGKSIYHLHFILFYSRILFYYFINTVHYSILFCILSLYACAFYQTTYAQQLQKLKRI